MTIGQLRRKIILTRTLDYFVFAAVTAFGVWGVMYSGKPAIMGGIALGGLFVVNRLGNYTITKITIMEQDIARLEREKGKAI